mmetsp:Transcript_19721/g.27353  ORF Transcript_19721/g.27353 Transcript_19721/m.27353 type:complete len:118 (-) Transcript_19721:941-1294(-)
MPYSRVVVEEESAQHNEKHSLQDEEWNHNVDGIHLVRVSIQIEGEQRRERDKRYREEHAHTHGKDNIEDILAIGGNLECPPQQQGWRYHEGEGNPPIREAKHEIGHSQAKQSDTKEH